MMKRVMQFIIVVMAAITNSGACEEVEIVPRRIIVALEHTEETRWQMLSIRSFVVDLIDQLPLGSEISILQFGSQVNELAHTASLTAEHRQQMRERVPKVGSRDSHTNLDLLIEALKKRASKPCYTVLVTQGASNPSEGHSFVDLVTLLPKTFPSEKGHAVLLVGLTDDLGKRVERLKDRDEVDYIRLDTRTPRPSIVWGPKLYAQRKILHPTVPPAVPRPIPTRPQPRPTRNPSPTPTPTSSPTETFTRTNTATPTRTASFTPSPSRTFTATPAPTETFTHTTTLTNTPTSTSTPSTTPSATHSGTPTPTISPTHTPTCSPTTTSTLTWIVQPTATTTLSPTVAVVAVGKGNRGPGRRSVPILPWMLGGLFVLGGAATAYRAKMKSTQETLLDTDLDDDWERYAAFSAQDQDGKELVYEEMLLDSKPLEISAGPRTDCTFFLAEAEKVVRLRVSPQWERQEEDPVCLESF